MNKSTLLLTTVAALGLGTLIGQSLIDDSPPAKPDDLTPTGTMPPPGNPMTKGDSLTFRFIKPGDIPVTYDQSGNAEPATVGENFVALDGSINAQEFTIELMPNEAKEYKAVMKQGDAIVYSWRSEKGPLYYDFHAHDGSFGEDFFTRYAEGNKDSDSGVVVAPYTGEHGWYWHNQTDQPLTIELELAGFFARVVKFDIN